MTRALTPKETPESKVTTQNANKNLDLTTIANRLWTFNWSKDSHQTGVVKPVAVNIAVKQSKGDLFSFHILC